MTIPHSSLPNPYPLLPNVPALHSTTSFLDPAVLARIDSLELLAKTVVQGFLTGLHRAPKLGMSMEFAEHRAYLPGDDTRRIDWRLYGRTDRFYIKEFEADTNANVYLLLDISRSMAFKSAGISKLDYARYLAACLAYFCNRQRDRVGLVTFANAIVNVVPPALKHLDVVLHTIDRVEASGRGALRDPLRAISEQMRRRSIVVLISDLYEEPRAVLEAATALRGNGNDLIVFHILDPAEREFPFDGAGTFEDLESGERIPIVPEQLRDEYRRLVAEHIASLTSLLGAGAADYALFDTSTPLDYALFRFLSSRLRATRVR